MINSPVQPSISSTAQAVIFTGILLLLAVVYLAFVRQSILRVKHADSLIRSRRSSTIAMRDWSSKTQSNFRVHRRSSI